MSLSAPLHRRRCDLPSHRIAAVPFTLRTLREDLEDVGSNFDGAPDLEFRMATKALELEQSGLSYQRIPPDYRFPYGHTHKEQEEVYVVLGGSRRMKLDDEIVEVKEWDVVRVPPGTWRGYESGLEGSRSSCSVRPISAKIREKTSRVSGTGGPTNSASRLGRAHSPGEQPLQTLTPNESSR